MLRRTATRRGSLTRPAAPQLDPEQRYSLPPDATIARLAAESGLERGQVVRFFERRLVPRPEPSSDAESDSESELEPWDFGLSEAQNAAPEDAKSATRRGLATSGPSSSDSEDEEEEEVRWRRTALATPGSRGGGG